MIRLAPRGKKNKPFYRIVVSEQTKDIFGDYLEAVGYYNPMGKEKEVHLNNERILHWISKGAQTSPTVHNILIDQKVITGEKIVKTKPVKKEKEEEKKMA